MAGGGGGGVLPAEEVGGAAMLLGSFLLLLPISFRATNREKVDFKKCFIVVIIASQKRGGRKR